MKITFACPSCAITGSSDEAHVGKTVRCNQCKFRFVIPRPGVTVDDGYGLEQPTGIDPSGLEPSPIQSSPVFVPTRGDEPLTVVSTRKPKPIRSKSRSNRDRVGFDRKPWRLGISVVVVVGLLATALFAPNGRVIVGSVMVAVGSLMVLVGYFAGAYGAFCEDFLYGFLYLVIPLYSAYYLVSRWEDLRWWLLGSTLGVGLVFCGTMVLQWAGVEI